MDDIAQSSKKSLGHASVIFLLCSKAGVADLGGNVMLRPAASLDVTWMKERTISVEEPRPLRQPHDHEAGSSGVRQPDAAEGVPQAAPPGVDEESEDYRFRMSQFCFMQDACYHMGIPGRYLTHQIDLWGAAQRFRDRYAGDPPAPHFGRYTHPGVAQPLQLGFDVASQQHPQSTPRQTPPQQTHPTPLRPPQQTTPEDFESMTPITRFLHDPRLDPTTAIDFDTTMQDGGDGEQF